MTHFRRSALLLISKQELLLSRSFNGHRRCFGPYDETTRNTFRSKNDKKSGESLRDLKLPRLTQPFHNVAGTNKKGNNQTSAAQRIPYPKEITDYLDQYVIGQKHAKKILAVGIYQHYKRLNYNLSLIPGKNPKAIHSAFDEDEDFPSSISSSFQSDYERYLIKQILKKNSPSYKNGKQKQKFSVKALQNTMERNKKFALDKSNIILLGPSGVGKTYLTTMLAEILDVPIAMCDCTLLTQAGYVGDDVDTVIQKLLQNADGDIERAEKGIVFLDEFDKISASVDLHSHGYRDVSGRGVQQALLKLVEGTTVKVKSTMASGMKVDVNTSNILFIASGAFNNLDRIVARRICKKCVGFGAETNTGHDEYLLDKDALKVSQRKDELLQQVDQADLISFGMVPELIGRFPVYVSFHSLDEKLLKRIMSEPKNSVISQAKEQFLLDKVNLIFTDCAFNEIAKIAVQKRTGARALSERLE